MGFLSWLKKKTKSKNEETEDLIDFESMYSFVNDLDIRGYTLKHADTCKKIWHDHVPQNGQSDTVQGELLRRLEKIRDEAQRNGNINWDDNYESFCTFIKDTLLGSGLFEEERERLAKSIEAVRKYGRYAKSYHDGEISDDDANPMLFAYVDDDLYDYITDAIAVFCEANKDPIKRDIDESIYR